MPTYHYRCSECGFEMEKMQSMNDAPLTSCSNCGTDQLKRVISAGSGFVLKGKGFYNTDYKNSCKTENAAPAGAPCCAGGSCGM
jgi:putative FmdB family regulatory protein